MAQFSAELREAASGVARDQLEEKTRVHALAKLLGISSAEMLHVLAAQGISDKRPASTVAKAQVESVLDVLVGASDAMEAGQEAASQALKTASDVPATPQRSAKKTPARKAAAKKRPAKKASATKDAVSAGEEKTAAEKKTAAKKSTAKQKAIKKSTAKKTTATTAKATAVETTSVKKSTAKKAAAETTVAEKTTPEDTTPKNAEPRGRAAKKATAKKATTHKVTTDKATADKDTAHKEIPAALEPEQIQEPRAEAFSATNEALAPELESPAETGRRQSRRQSMQAAESAQNTDVKMLPSEQAAQEVPSAPETGNNRQQARGTRRIRRVVRRFGGTGVSPQRVQSSDQPTHATQEEPTLHSSSAAPSRSAQISDADSDVRNSPAEKVRPGTRRSKQTPPKPKPEQLHPAERDEDDIVDEPVRLKGSTRLESRKKWRSENRKELRHVVTRSEFLARRESVERIMVVQDSQRTDHLGLTTQVGVVEDGMLVEHFVTSETQQSQVGNIYLGIVQNVLASMEAAFIDIGTGRNAVLYAGEMNWHATGLHSKNRRMEAALRPGDYILVQVIKDIVGHKGARLTARISFAGRFLVYFPGGTTAGISRKLPEAERKRLKEILSRVIPGEGGAIIRTAAENVEEEDIAEDVQRLHAQWENLLKEEEIVRSQKEAAPATLYEEPHMLVKVLRDILNRDFSQLIVDGEKSWATVEDYVSRMATDLHDRVEKWQPELNGGAQVFASMGLDEQLSKALSHKVWLPSGGHLVFDQTEAMTVIDVNTGSFVGAGGNLEETVTRNNLEAAEEIVRQMRLRDLGGMIVVDFIDMVLEENQDLVLRRLTEYLGRDRTRHKVSEVTSLGLVQMTRKRLGTGLLETFSTVCEHCGGRGIIIHADPVSHEEEQQPPRRDHGHRRERQQARREKQRREEYQQRRQERTQDALVGKENQISPPDTQPDSSAHEQTLGHASEDVSRAAGTAGDVPETSQRRRRHVRRHAFTASRQEPNDVSSAEPTENNAQPDNNTGESTSGTQSHEATQRSQRRMRRVVRRNNLQHMQVDPQASTRKRDEESSRDSDRMEVRRAETRRRGRRVVRSERYAEDHTSDQREPQEAQSRPPAGYGSADATARDSRRGSRRIVRAQSYQEAREEFERSPRRKRRTRGNSRSDFPPRPEDFTS